MNEFQQPTEFLDYQTSEMTDFLMKFQNFKGNQIELAIQVYLHCRDFQLYDPYHLNLKPQALKASVICMKKRAWCVEKSILLAAAARSLGIPSKLGFAIVKNHLQIDKLLGYLKKDEIVFHGYVSLFLDNKWVRCTPAFDRRICRVSGVEPLEFDGRNDSMFQEFSQQVQFMQYLHYYGEFPDVPLDLMRSEMKAHYPHLFEENHHSSDFSFLY